VAAIFVLGVLLALVISLRDAPPSERANIIRALSGLFRRGRPPGGGAV
jgi:hypothetical protein